MSGLSDSYQTGKMIISFSPLSTLMKNKQTFYDLSEFEGDDLKGGELKSKEKKVFNRKKKTKPYKR